MSGASGGSTGEPPVARVAAPGATYPVVVPHHGSDYIQGHLMTSGTPYEPDLLAAIAEVVGPDDLVLDVGANIGNHTLYLAHVTGCRVESFEPNAELAAALEASVRAGGLEGRVQVNAHALGSRARRAHLDHVDESNLGGFRVTEVADGAEGDIEVRVLDDRLDSLPPVRAMKIDVEGAEMEVLAGAEQVIARDRPLLFIEAMDVASLDALAAWVGAHDYVYQATFNATPTHAFRPARPGEADLAPVLLDAVRRVTELGADVAELRAARDHASVRYREAQVQIRADRDRFAERSATQQRKHDDEVARLRERVQALEAELDGLRSRKVVRAADAVGRRLRGRGD